ncbi:RagB/SusD family nutrient uptake outer membrane protein [Parapedobacter sp. SGR-10]|uniref:RagB/SusD family nutrient uptake outer membrane protein n=1 Tax=Parapedobacter sp. SGR-10 TaxID=2710879 RepID=UPI0013D38DC7|nr:RagB/SusD family nutrient uptake outer membrane protein [Parapedobacter sp. SGR-10]NGF56472.1 RagB/SusD family nutrient uptake outer membrane protein [Parapedobacter sp. SGR-10]
MKAIKIFFRKKKEQSIIVCILITGLLAVSSCSGFLDIEPKANVSDESTIVDRASLNTALRGVYRTLADYYGNYTRLGFVPSGNVVYQVFNNTAELNFLPEDADFGSTWSAIYRTINAANHIIEKAPGITDVNLSEADKNTALGEAHFIRALAYFDLARAFGGVPLKLTPTTDAVIDGKIPRSSLADTYAQVLTDLEAAENLLPANVTVNRIRATRHSVWALRARYHLYNKQWGDAIKYATDVINLNANYELLAPFSVWFKNNVVQTRESIFELAFSAQNPNSSLRTTMTLLSKGGEYRFRPTDDVVNFLLNPSTGGGRVAFLDSEVQGGVTQYAGSLYYRSPATDPIYVLRIAEQYLIRAEAKAQLGGTELQGAIHDLNAVRNRAALLGTDAVTQEEVLAAILEERRFEFLWEAHRYYDLTRTGKLKEEIERLKPNLTITNRHYFFPIPIGEIVLGNGIIEPNPDY